MRTRRKVSPEFKQTAVRWLDTRPVAEVARDCQISVSVLHRWRRQFSEHRVQSAAGRRKFTMLFKAAAMVRLDQGTPVAEVASALGVRPNTLHRWRWEVRKFGSRAFSGYGKSRAASGPARVIKISLTPGEYVRVRAAFESSAAPSLPDFARTRLTHPVDDCDFAPFEAKLDDLAGILDRMFRTLIRESAPEPIVLPAANPRPLT